MSTRVGITGGYGFLGWHTACRLHSLGVDVQRLGRDDLATAHSPTFAGLDAICHFAGHNRGEPDEVRDGNISAARQVIERINEMAAPPKRFVYANSTQSQTSAESPYGASKRQAGDELRQFCDDRGIEWFEAVIPNVFGEGGRPFYNSFVATFCHQLAIGEAPTVIEDRDVTLIHAQAVARIVGDAALDGTAIPNPMPGTPTTVRTLLALLESQLAVYRDGIFPELETPFEIDLFNTLRAAIYAQRGPVVSFTKHTDPRGWLVETVKAHTGGQSFVSSTVPGITRGQHYHLRKIERFVVLQGDALIQQRRLFSTDIASYPVSGDEPVAVEIPTLHTHLITNVGDGPLITLFWSNEIFDPDAPDTFGLVIAEGSDR